MSSLAISASGSLTPFSYVGVSSAREGLNDADPEAASIKRAMSALFVRVLLLADQGKIGLRALAQVCWFAGPRRDAGGVTLSVGEAPEGSPRR